MRRSTIAALVLGSLILVATPRVSRAQGIGFQGGMTIDPEQGYVGSHFETNEIARGLHLRPSIDGAFGNNLTIASINVDFLYKYPIGSAWKIYQGGGPVVYILRAGHPPVNDVTGGFTGVFGFAHESGFFAEFKASSGAGPGLKFGIGFTIR